jgi:hypothetical protein
MEEYQKKFLAENSIPENIPVKRQREEETQAEDVDFEAKIHFAEKIRKSSSDLLIRIISCIEAANKNAIEKIGDFVRIKVDKLDKTTFESINQ